MKKLILTSVIAFLLAGSSALAAKDYPEEYLGLPGDNLNLYAVMDLFRESATLEGFERSLNDPDKIINNLDLNGDNFVDYVMVKDYIDGNVHNIVLSVALNARETQDVAVFTVEKLSNGSVWIQLIGDEALYGKNYIIEPVYDETPNPGYRGNTRQTKTVKVVTTTYYEVAAWPVVRYIFVPTYVVYYSPWYWGYYPVYWTSWSPYYWHYYYGYHYNCHPHYYSYYRPWPHHRYHRYNDFYYTGIRHRSPQVATYVSNGHYRSTYSRPDEMSRGINRYEEVRKTGNAGRSSSLSPNSTGTSPRAANTATHNSKSTSTVGDSRNTTQPAPAVKNNRSNSNTRVQSNAAPATKAGTTVKSPNPSVAPSAGKATPSTSVSRTQVSGKKEPAPKAAAKPQAAKTSTKTSDRSSVTHNSNTREKSSVSTPSRNSSSNASPRASRPAPATSRSSSAPRSR